MWVLDRHVQAADGAGQARHGSSTAEPQALYEQHAEPALASGDSCGNARRAAAHYHYVKVTKAVQVGLESRGQISRVGHLNAHLLRNI
jgi:hypothetical protein